MSSSNSPTSQTSNSYVEQTVSVLSSVASYMRLPALASTGLAAVLTSLLYFKQKALIYPSNIPANSRSDVPKPSDFGISNFEELYIPTDDGEKLSAFYIRGPRGHKNSNITILMFHGNAGNIGHRLPIARMIINYIGCNVFMLEYRGYGSSTGQPDESGLNVDAQTGLNYLRQRAETRDHKLMVYGQSLGGAVAIKLVSKNQEAGDIAGLILENTFLSIRKLIPSVVPPAKYLTLLCHQVWPSESVLPNITKVPTLFISGLQDEIVPPKHMKQLYDLSAAPTKRWKPLPGGDHNSSVLEEGYFEAMSDFIAEVTGDTPQEKTRLKLLAFDEGDQMEGVEQDNAENHSPQTKGAEEKCIDAKMTDAEVDKACYVSQAE
ncbi:related to S.pombe Bem46 protein [Fusarium fujikuroi]|nr:related to S.pombe Bem46 protein [Fusarium fujikuroi]SCN94893.1 related to S.pombe Bem46 protein [Fusarium fujikuroi]SCO48318.1 related to S.pombe Bem46 protein [Fusarium fujikuroi]SCV30993.1 related to S.pombe Bem46 protein [Fusarium fujikuroi]